MATSTAAKDPAVAESLARVAQAYSDPSWWYNLRGIFLLLLAHRTTFWTQVRFFAKSLGPRHLEVPVGNGTIFKFVLWTRMLRRRPKAVQIAAVDYSPTMILAAARAFRRYANVQVQRGDVARLPFVDGSFDSVHVSNGLHCFPDADAALDELCRVLAPGGMFAASVLLHPRGPRLLRRMSQAVYDWGSRKGLFLRPFALEDLRTRLEARGLKILEERLCGNTVNVRATKAVIWSKVHSRPLRKMP